MRPLAFTFPYFVVFAGVFFWAFVREAGIVNRAAKAAAKGGALGASFTGEVRVRPDQRVVSSGPYRWVRHPSYTAGILMIVGMAFALDSWLAAAISFATSLAGYSYRVSVEERALAGAIGAPYR